MNFQTISVIGLGYIGLPTAAMFAGRKCNVVGVEINSETVEIINRGSIHIVEPDLEISVNAAVTAGYLRATTNPEEADAFLITVPTPFKDDHKPDLEYVEQASRSIAPVLKKGDLIVLESTSPVGTTEKVSQWLAEERPDLGFPHSQGESADINIAYCPERVMPGRVMQELIHNDRIVGGLTRRCAERAAGLYKTFVTGECLLTDSRTAEMCKLTENAYRDVNIAFANELSIICDRLGINVWEMIKLANHHPRVKILEPGPGVGGHCIAVDPWFIIDAAPDEARLIRTSREVNDDKSRYVLEQIDKALLDTSDSTVACFGLSFKADIDDLRESSALAIVKKLVAHHQSPLLIVEPHIKKLPPSLSGHQNVKLVTASQALEAADVVVMLVNHKSFYQIDHKQLNNKVVIDTRGVWS